MFTCSFGLILKLFTILFVRELNQIVGKEVNFHHLKNLLILESANRCSTNQLPIHGINLCKYTNHDVMSRAQIDAALMA